MSLGGGHLNGIGIADATASAVGRLRVDHAGLLEIPDPPRSLQQTEELLEHLVEHLVRINSLIKSA